MEKKLLCLFFSLQILITKRKVTFKKIILSMSIYTCIKSILRNVDNKHVEWDMTHRAIEIFCTAKLSCDLNWKRINQHWINRTFLKINFNILSNCRCKIAASQRIWLIFRRLHAVSESNIISGECASFCALAHTHLLLFLWTQQYTQNICYPVYHLPMCLGSSNRKVVYLFFFLLFFLICLERFS